MPAKKPTVTNEEVTSPQIEDKKIENPTDHGQNSEVAASPPQTDAEIVSDEAANSNALNSNKETVSEEVPIVQTEPNEEKPSAAGFEDAVNSGENNASPQTDAGTPENLAPEPPAAEEAAETPDENQTEPEKPKRTRRRRKDPEDSQNQSDEKDENSKKTNPDGVEGAEKPKLRISLPKRANIMAIDDELGVVTDADKAKNELLDLLESYRGKKHLSGKIQGIENPTGEPSKALAVLAYGEYKVIIPLHEAVEPPDDLKGQPLDYALNYMLNKRLGAEIDYIVKGIDAKAKIAVGSRVEAMQNKRKSYYFGTDRDGNYILYSDICAEARVVSVVRSGIFVDLFGLEVFIPLSELSYQRMMDAESYFAPGQRTLVKILEVDRSNRKNIRVKASVKQAGENPYEKALRKYVIGNRYVGTVSLVDVNGVFVSLDGGIDCLCNYPKRGRPPKGARVTIRVLGINYNTNRMWGAITHVASAR